MVFKYDFGYKDDLSNCFYVNFIDKDKTASHKMSFGKILYFLKVSQKKRKTL